MWHYNTFKNVTEAAKQCGGSGGRILMGTHVLFHDRLVNICNFAQRDSKY